MSHQSLDLFPGKPASVLPLGMSEPVTRRELNLHHNSSCFHTHWTLSLHWICYINLFTFTKTLWSCISQGGEGIDKRHPITQKMSIILDFAKQDHDWISISVFPALAQRCHLWLSKHERNTQTQTKPHCFHLNISPENILHNISKARKEGSGFGVFFHLITS